MDNLMTHVCALRLYPLDGRLRAMRVREDVAGAVGEQLRADARAERRRALPRPSRMPANGAAADERDYHGDELQSVAVLGRRERADRRLTSTAERLDDRALGFQRRAGRSVVDVHYRTPRVVVAVAGTHAAAGSVSEMRDAKPRRRNPAAASTSAS